MRRLPAGLSYLPYQREGIREMLARPDVLLADEMGLGKTVQAIGLANELGRECSRILVVAPASLRINWRREIVRWQADERDVFLASPKEWPMLLVDSFWVVVSYASLTKLRSRLRSVEWDMLILDEAHFIKNPKAKRTREVVGHRPRNSKTGRTHIQPLRAKRRLLLTGTPITNRPVDMWQMLSFLEPKRWNNWLSFVNRYCGGLDAWGSPMGATNLVELHERISSSVMIRRLKADVLADLPPKRRQTLVFGVETSAERDALEAEAKLLDDLRVAGVAPRIAFDQMAQVRHDTAMAKAPKVVSHVRDTLEAVDKLVVFAHHHDVIDVIAGRLRDVGVNTGVLDGRTPMAERQKTIDEFQSGSMQVFLGSIQASGVGITLTAASHCMFAELDWTPANLIQAEDRLHRIGQRDSISIVYLVIENSIDSKIAASVVDKMGVFGRVLDADAGRIPLEEIID